MTEDDISAAVTMWQEHGAADLPWNDIERALRRLPDSGICAVSDDATELFMLARNDTLFTVCIERGQVTLRSRPLEAARLTVSMCLEENSSRWTFGYAGEPKSREPWQHMSGSLKVDAQTGREDLDDREQFARALAGRAGWAKGIHEPSAADPASASPSEEPGKDEPRWREQTDVWGRPLDVGRR